MSQYRDQRIAFPVFFLSEDAGFTEIYRFKRRKSGAEYRETIFFLIKENLYETEESKNEFGKKTQPDRMGIFNSAALLIFIFCFYPMIQAIILSFTKGSRICRTGKLREY